MKIIITVICSLLISFAALAQDSTVHISTAHLTGNFYVYTSYGKYQDVLYPANGVYVVTDSGIVIIDTPWTEDQTQQLADSLEEKYHKKIIYCIATHFHADRTAGLDLLKKLGAKTYTSELTRKWCKDKGEKQAEFTFKKDTTFNINGLVLKTYFPGEGHSRDNIVIWFPKEKILYGGCFIKSLDVNAIGYTGDGNVKEWPASLKKVMAKYPSPVYVIPGHEGWQGGKLLYGHTMKIIQ